MGSSGWGRPNLLIFLWGTEKTKRILIRMFPRNQFVTSFLNLTCFEFDCEKPLWKSRILTVIIYSYFYVSWFEREKKLKVASASLIWQQKKQKTTQNAIISIDHVFSDLWLWRTHKYVFSIHVLPHFYLADYNSSVWMTKPTHCFIIIIIIFCVCLYRAHKDHLTDHDYEWFIFIVSVITLAAIIKPNAVCQWNFQFLILMLCSSSKREILLRTHKLMNCKLNNQNGRSYLTGVIDGHGWWAEGYFCIPFQGWKAA